MEVPREVVVPNVAHAWIDVVTLLRVYWPLFLGNILEWYEFGIFGYLEKELEELFFEGSTMATWLGFAVTFVARPFGGFALGLSGDCCGRRLAANVSILGMLFATVCQGLLPVHNSFGVIALITLRLLQGLCTGGEIGTISTYITEVGNRRSMGICISIVSITSTLGFLASLIIVSSVRAGLSVDDMKVFGWRIPFLLAIIPGSISVVARRWLPESDMFTECCTQSLPLKSQRSDVGKHESLSALSSGTLRHLCGSNPLSLLIATFGVVEFAIVQYVGLVWTNSFLVKRGLGSANAFWVTCLARIVQTLFTLPVAWLADSVGIGLVTLVSGIVVALLGLPLFAIVAYNPTSLAAAFLCFGVGFGFFGAVAGTVVFAYVVELFPTSVRASGVGIGWNVGFGICGGFGPLLATASLQHCLIGPGIILSVGGLLTALSVVAGRWLEGRGLMRMAHIRTSPYFGVASAAEEERDQEKVLRSFETAQGASTWGTFDSR